MPRLIDDKSLLFANAKYLNSASHQGQSPPRVILGPRDPLKCGPSTLSTYDFPGRSAHLHQS